MHKDKEIRLERLLFDRRPYIFRFLDCFTQTFNTWILNGSPDESTSGRAYFRQFYKPTKFWRVMYKIINTIFFLEEDHCKDAYLKDLKRSKIREEIHKQLFTETSPTAD